MKLFLLLFAVRSYQQGPPPPRESTFTQTFFPPSTTYWTTRWPSWTKAFSDDSDSTYYDSDSTTTESDSTTGCTGEETFSNSIDLSCDSENFDVSIDQCVFKNIGIEKGKLYLSGANDTGNCPFDEYKEGRYYLSADYRNSEDRKCATGTETNGTHLIYNNVLKSVYGKKIGWITRQRTLRVDLSCAMELEKTISLESAVNTFIVNVDMLLEGALTGLNCFMGLWSDKGYETALTAPVNVEIPDRMYIGTYFGLLDGEAIGDYRVKAKQCWATPSSDPEDEKYYMFIGEYCPMDETVVIYDYSENMNGEYFSIESFLWRMEEEEDEGEIYIHCTVRLCDPTVEDCSNNCSGRKRRSVGSEDTAEISLGPIVVTKSQD